MPFGRCTPPSTNHQRGLLCLCNLRWCKIVAPKIDGEGHSPNTSRVNLKCTMFGFSNFGSLNHKNRRKSRCSTWIPAIKKTFSMSAVKPTMFLRKFANMLKRVGDDLGQFVNNRSMIFHAWKLSQIHRKQFSIS